MIVEGIKGRLAVECDGGHWHGPEHFEKDMARQRDLERCGCVFWRVTESNFYLNPDKALETLWEALESRGIKPGSEQEKSGSDKDLFAVEKLKEEAS